MALATSVPVRRNAFLITCPHLVGCQLNCFHHCLICLPSHHFAPCSKNHLQFHLSSSPLTSLTFLPSSSNKPFCIFSYIVLLLFSYARLHTSFPPSFGVSLYLLLCHHCILYITHEESFYDSCYSSTFAIPIRYIPVPSLEW